MNSTFTENNASGSLIINNAGSVNIVNSNFTKNNAESTDTDGLIYNYKEGTLNITNSTFIENNANSGGVLYNHYNSSNTIIMVLLLL